VQIFEDVFYPLFLRKAVVINIWPLQYHRNRPVAPFARITTDEQQREDDYQQKFK